MNKFSGKFALIGITTLLGFIAFWPPESKLKTGIDLSGGTILVYQIKKDSQPTNFDMDELITSLKRRINPEGVLDIPIRKLGGDRIEIILPKASAEEVEEVKAKMTDVGSLEFRILANRKHDGDVVPRAMGKNGLTDLPKKYMWAKLGEVVTGKNPTVSDDKTKITDTSQHLERNAYAGQTVVLNGKTAAGTDQSLGATIASNTATTLVLAKPATLASISSYTIDYNPSEIRGPVPGAPPRPSDEIIRDEQVSPGRTIRYILVNADRPDRTVTGAELARVYQTQDDRLQPAVGFTFNRKGSRLFGTLTQNHLPEEEGAFKFRLAILLDGIVRSAPSINSQIKDQGIIEFGSGGNVKEVSRLIAILQSGKLPASLNPEPLQEENIGPTLGEDTIAKGITAIIISLLVVPIFMIIYYRFAGLVAVVALILNTILLLGSMAALQASFTLPGLAGFALTIGMAVDANVLVFERIREEAERGAGMAQQIRNGFNRAWLTIFDSHITIFLSGLVLYFVGTDEVKGFALTLIIGMVWNLFTAVYVSRVIFDFWYAKGWLKKLTMMKLLDKTHIDFIGPRKICMAASVVVIALGLVACVARGKGMFNIDFTGGTLVTIRLNDQNPEIKALDESQRANYVRKMATEKAKLPDVTVESLNVGGVSSGARYNIRTTEKKIDEIVKPAILEAFGSTLARVDLKIGEAKPIAPLAEAADGRSAAPIAGVSGRFAGGRQYELKFNQPMTPTKVAALLRKVVAEAGVANPDSRFEVNTPAGAMGAESDALILRTDLDEPTAQKDLAALATAVQSDRSLLFEQSESIGETVAGETRTLAIIATVASWVIIAGYLWFRFKSLSYGLAAVIAVIHDVLITLGAVAVTYWLALIPGVRELLLIDQLKIDLPMIAAFLTLIGFSVNDTIVIFDRIREIKGKSPVLTAQTINDAVNQTLSRTILTSLTAWLVVVILYIFGGEGLHGFAFALVVGFLSGTYSTVYIASPILIDWVGNRAVGSPPRSAGGSAPSRSPRPTEPSASPARS